ncbi:PIG-L deacetylase family protein [Aeromicrobium sp.]|uniref:PIG-L deacetylase family protein n=1 Tax=Aeromicrobium sp. TaxID=1871063 RepID=UPI003C396A3A
MSDSWSALLEGVPTAAPLDPGGKIVVLSAHPDDEVLAAGGWLSTQTDREVVFVTATDGEASHPGSPTITSDELRARRPLELLDALDRLGFDEPDVRRLSLPDGELDRRRVELRELLRPLIESASLVLAPFAHDGHPDHDALGQVAVEVCPATTTLWQLPIWTWSWTRPADQWWVASIRRLASTSAARERKRQAIDAFATQVRALSPHTADSAVLDERMLAHACDAPEAVIV